MAGVPLSKVETIIYGANVSADVAPHYNVRITFTVSTGSARQCAEADNLSRLNGDQGGEAFRKDREQVLNSIRSERER